jgi:putative spermidine/putrescine transport system permease protein
MRRGVGSAALRVYLLLFFVYLETPLLIMLVTSFSQGASMIFPPDGFSLRWYARLWQHVAGASGTKPGLVVSLWTSVWVGAVAVAGAVVAGVLAALGLRRARFRGRALLRQLVLLPILFPQVVTGVGLLLWFSAWHGVPSWFRIIVGHMILTLPYVTVTTEASLEMMDERLEEAAMNLGANGLRAFWYVTLPSIRAGVISGAVFAWLVSFANFTVTFFLYSGEVRPLPVWIYEVMQFSVDPTLAALSSVLIVLTLCVVLIMSRLFALGRLVGLRK